MISFCPNCGKKLPDKPVKFCPHCGEDLVPFQEAKPEETTPSAVPDQRQPEAVPPEQPIAEPADKTPADMAPPLPSSPRADAEESDAVPSSDVGQAAPDADAHAPAEPAETEPVFPSPPRMAESEPETIPEGEIEPKTSEPDAEAPADDLEKISDRPSSPRFEYTYRPELDEREDEQTTDRETPPPLPPDDEETSASDDEPSAPPRSDWEHQRLIDLSEVPPMDEGALEQMDVRTGPTWESPGDRGKIGAFFRTIVEVLFSPGYFFQSMRVRGGFFEPLIFAIAISWIGGFLLLLWRMVLPVDVFLGNNGFGGSELSPEMQNYMQIGLTILMPLFTIISVFIYTAIFHLFLLMLNGSRHGFEATFRVVCYVSAASIFYLLPVLGEFIGPIYAIVLYIIGIKEAQEIEGLKATGVVLLPIFLLICCCGAFILGMLSLAGLGQ